MTASSSPDPDEPDALDPWERRVLASIEDDLAASDPGLADRMTGQARHPTPSWWPMSIRATLLLAIVQAVLVAAVAFVPPSLHAVLGPLTVLVVVPWVLLCAIENARVRRPEPGTLPGAAGADRR